jgi:acyl carrier protein
MERKEMLKQVNDIFIKTLENGSIEILDSTTADDVDEWDSLTHIQLVVGIEKHFEIRFTSREIQSWNNVGELIDCIEGKIQQ